MSVIKPLAETRDSVTLARADYDALLDAVAIADDVRVIDAQVAREKVQGTARARREYLSVAEMQRLLDGENQVRFWREKRGVQQGALADAIDVTRSYLAEVEADRKPGSVDLYRRVAGFLDLPLERLLPVETGEGAAAMALAERAAERLARLLEGGASRAEMVAEVRSIVGEWRAGAEATGVSHQVKAMVSRLRSLLRREGKSPLMDAAIEAVGREVRNL